MIPKPVNEETMKIVGIDEVIYISPLDCWYYSRRNQLVQRGLSIQLASQRALKLAYFLETRRFMTHLRTAPYIETYNDSPPEMWGYPDPFGGPFIEEDQGYGFCSNCGSALTNRGAASHGDGDIFDEIGCDHCGEVEREIHADYCQCVDCQSGYYEEEE